MGNSKNTDKGKEREREKTGGEELGYFSGLRRLEARSGYCLRLSFHWVTYFAGDLGGFVWGRRDNCVMGLYVAFN
jgi:hypothetical protein